MELNKIHIGDCLEGMRLLPDNYIDCCVTSPPYYRLRDYGNDAQLGLEKTPELYVLRMVEVFEEVRRILKNDGTLWLNIGDSYAGTGSGDQKSSTLQGGKGTQIEAGKRPAKINLPGIKPKDLIGIPWMVAFALRSSGWYLRQDIIWAKDAVMPESVLDRCTKSHEYIFLLSKSRTYYFDNKAIQEDAVYDVDGAGTIKRKKRQMEDNKSFPDNLKNGIRNIYPSGKNGADNPAVKTVSGTRNKRDVWRVNPKPFKEAHFATFPQELIVDCIKAGSKLGGVVLDPFMGAGTTALVAKKLDRNFIGFELNPKYVAIAERRLKKELGLFA